MRERVGKRKREWKEQITEKQQEKRCPKKDNVRTLTGNRKEIKKGEDRETKDKHVRPKKKRRRRGDKRKNKESSRSMANILRRRGRRDRRRGKERKRSYEHDKKTHK